MEIERFPIADRKAWLERRKPDVTASVAGALLGVHEYKTAFELWAEKSGMLERDDADSPAMRRGRMLEPIALQSLREEQPKWDVRQNKFYLRSPELRIGATPDIIANDPERGLGVVQVKTVEPMIFRQKWRTEDGGIEPPLWIAVQAIVEAKLADAKWAAVAPLVVGHGIDMPIIDIPIHDGIFAKLSAAVESFWKSVEAKEPPDPDFSRDGATLERIFHGLGEPIDLSGDEELMTLLAEKAELSTMKNDAEKRLKAIKAELLAKMKDAQLATLGDGRIITAKTVNRAGYTVEPCSYVDLRVKKGK